MRIRAVRPEDVGGLQRNCFGASTVEETETLVRDLVQDQERGEVVCLVAVEDDGEVLGTCTLTRLEHRMCRHRADIGGFVVATSAQGTGLARKIVQAAEDKARSWGCTILEISCRGGTHAEDAYVGLGFIRWGRLPGGYHDRDGQVFDEVRLWRSIPTT